jgi:hypothetical protein
MMSMRPHAFITLNLATHRFRKLGSCDERRFGVLLGGARLFLWLDRPGWLGKRLKFVYDDWHGLRLKRSHSDLSVGRARAVSGFRSRWPMRSTASWRPILCCPPGLEVKHRQAPG